jgi:hypothetical protein
LDSLPPCHGWKSVRQPIHALAVSARLPPCLCAYLVIVSQRLEIKTLDFVSSRGGRALPDQDSSPLDAIPFPDSAKPGPNIRDFAERPHPRPGLWPPENRRGPGSVVTCSPSLLQIGPTIFFCLVSILCCANPRARAGHPPRLTRVFACSVRSGNPTASLFAFGCLPSRRPCRPPTRPMILPIFLSSASCLPAFSYLPYLPTHIFFQSLSSQARLV